MSRPKLALVPCAAALAFAIAACGQQEIKLDKQDKQNAQIAHGAQLFNERCSGCHSLDAASARGSKPSRQVSGGERTNGPNFNVRQEQVNDVLYAIRNGGFSGAIMPANIVVGQDQQDVAQFVSKYAGRHKGQSPNNIAPANPNPGSP